MTNHQPTQPPSLALYVSRLQSHDWHYEFADRQMQYAAGKSEREWLIATQQQIDVHAIIWNKHAPVKFQRKVAS